MDVRADLHVAPDGSDAQPGTRAKPFATLERARDAARALREAGQLPRGGLTIWLQDGDYRRTNALELTEADSGTEGAPIVWRGERSGRARLLGGPTLSGFRPVSDPAVLSRLDAAARPHVREVDVSGLAGWPIAGSGGTGTGTGTGKGPEAGPSWMKSRGFARPTTPSHPELFFGTRPMTLARWPNEGAWEKIAGLPEGQGKGDDHGGRIGDLPGGFHYAGDRPSRWKNTGDLWVHGYWAWDWANSYERVAELDLARRFVRTAPPHGLYGFRVGQRIHFLNILEELDQPGEWFLDRAAGRLYFWPPAPLESGEALLSLLDQPFVRINGASHLTFQDLAMEATRGTGVEIRGGRGVRVMSCLLRNIGNTGVAVSGGSNHHVIGCDIFDTGDGGVVLDGGDRQTLTPSGHTAEHNHFQRQGRWSKCYVPAILMNGVGQQALRNHIHDHPHCAILFNGNDHLIEGNDIHHIALESGDVGAIYTGRDYSYRGNRIRRNYIHETGGVGMGSMGVYMDDCVSGTEVTGNIFYRAHWAMFIGGGRDHVVENNLFVECDPAVRADARGLDRAPVWRSMVENYMRQQLAAVPAALYRERYPEIRALDAFYGPPGGPALTGTAFTGIPAENNRIARNVCVGKWLELGWHASAAGFTVTNNYVTTNRLAVGSAAEGFPLPRQSPAWKLGFKPIPFDQIGPRRDADRRHLEGLSRRDRPAPSTRSAPPAPGRP